MIEFKRESDVTGQVLVAMLHSSKAIKAFPRVFLPRALERKESPGEAVFDRPADPESAILQTWELSSFSKLASCTLLTARS